MLKNIFLLGGYALILTTIAGCATTNTPSDQWLLEEHKALIRGQSNKGLKGFIASSTKDGVGKHTEIIILAIDGKEVPENSQDQVIVPAGKREVKALCNVRIVVLDRMIGLTPVTKTQANISNEVIYTLSAEPGHNYQLISEVTKDGKCVISTEEYGLYSTT